MNWLVNNIPLVGELTVWHLALAIPAIILSFVVSVPLGWLAWQYRWSRGVVLTLSGLLYAIPSLPLLVFLPVILGTGLRNPVNVVVALTLYGAALLVRASADAFADIPRSTLEVATAMGFSRFRRFLNVELPLALPGLLAGLRVVTVSTVSLVTVSAVLGTPNLGLLFTDGIQRGIAAEILTGIFLTVVLAVALDAIVLAAERAATPWARLPRTTQEVAA